MTKEEFEAWVAKLPNDQPSKRGILYRDPARARTRSLRSVPYSIAYKSDLKRAAKLLEEAAALTPNKSLQGFPAAPGESVPKRRLLRQRRRLDGARRAHRHHHRAVRDLHGRDLRVQGGVRSLRHAARRRRNRQAQDVRRSSAGDREQSADGSEVPQSEDRRAGADSRGESGSGHRRWRARSSHRGVQSSQRRAHRAKDGIQARDAQERAGGEVFENSGADCEARAGSGGSARS